MNTAWNWRKQRKQQAFLALADGTIFRGFSVGAPVDAVGEVVFNTGMTGYQEILSDPSYAGQFVTMTYPEIGNYGMNAEDNESRQLFANGLIIHALNMPSNWRSRETLSDSLMRAGIPAMAGVDTRALTTKLRSQGTQKACLAISGNLTEREAIQRSADWCGLDGQDYAARVTCASPYHWDETGALTRSWGIAEKLPPLDIKIAAYDFGIKWNILRCLRRSGMDVTVVPAKTSAEAVLGLKPDGVFFSNGPADPAAVTYAIEAARGLIGKVPLMGICLGHQILGIALGGKTYRLKFGHHGCNHPVKNMATGNVEITSQNHNFAVAAESLISAKVALTHVNLNDNTVEGFEHNNEPLFAVQYHPESAPGPHDPFYLFAHFREMIRRRR